MEFVSGVATNVATRLASYAAQEVSLAWGAQAELKKLNKTMLIIKLVLEDAEEKQINNPLITHWLGNLKDVCNDAEDVLDEFDFQKLQQQVLINKNRSSRLKAKVHQFFFRWNPVVFNFKMGHKLKEIRVRLDEIDREKRQFSLHKATEASHVVPRVQDGERMTDSVVEPLAIIGRDGDKEQIIKHLLSDGTDHSSDDDENCSVISIVGLGGLGKTTLAKLVYNDDVVEEYFEKKMWVCVSETFVIQTLVESIIVAATEEECEYPNLDLMKRGLQQTLRGKKFLLVLDDVWDTWTTGVTFSKWRELKTLLNIGANGSKVVVTTRNLSVASLMDSVYTHNLKGLDDDDCISLFIRRAFRKGDEQHYPHLVKIGEEIVKKCGGVPLAIDALGSMLHSKMEQRDWVRVRDQMFSSKENDRTMQALKLSYDSLPSYLKPCFAFCSLFPKDYDFWSVDIVSLWMAQGYLTSSSGLVQNFEEIGLNYVREFCSRSLFQVESDMKTMVVFKIHDLVHDLAISVASVGYSRFNSRPIYPLKQVRHVSISIKDLSEDENSVPEFMLQSQKLRTILFRDKAEDAINILSFLRTCFSRFKFVRVIDLRESTIGEIPSSIGNLSHLKFLDLSGNKLIRRLPNSICRLLKLEYLEFGGCEALEELPKDIGNLINLRCLSISTQQIHLPKGTFRGLRLLQVLAFRNCIHLKSLGEELEYLDNLRQLGLIECENLESLPPNLNNLQEFDTLMIRDCKKLELMKSGQGIRGLQLFGIRDSNLEALPDWLRESSNTLRSIIITDCDNLTTLPEWLADLKLLEALWITDCPQLPALPQGLHRLTALRELTIRYCPELSKGCKRQFKGEEWARFVRDLKKIELDDVVSDDEEDEVADQDDEMKGLIRLRSPGNDDEEEEGGDGSSESDVEEHVEVERRLDHDLSRFEMIYPNYSGVEYNNVLENRVDDQDTHIAQLEEENLTLKERLFLMERELGDLRRRMLFLERRHHVMEEVNEEVVENGSENESDGGSDVPHMGIGGGDEYASRDGGARDVSMEEYVHDETNLKGNDEGRNEVIAEGVVSEKVEEARNELIMNEENANKTEVVSSEVETKNESEFVQGQVSVELGEEKNETEVMRNDVENKIENELMQTNADKDEEMGTSCAENSNTEAVKNEGETKV